jgi:hypothetical protein
MYVPKYSHASRNYIKVPKGYIHTYKVTFTALRKAVQNKPKG